MSVSIPRTIFDAAELLAGELKVSRTYLYAMALTQFIDVREAASLTESLNAVYAVESSKLDAYMERVQLEILKDEAW